MAVASVWDMIGVATVEERSYADANLRTDKGENEYCEHREEGVHHHGDSGR